MYSFLQYSQHVPSRVNSRLGAGYTASASTKEPEVSVIDGCDPNYAFGLALRMLGFDFNVMDDIMGASLYKDAPRLTRDWGRVYAILRPISVDMHEVRTDIVPPYFVQSDRHISRAILGQQGLDPVSATVNIANFFRKAYREETGEPMEFAVPYSTSAPVPDWPSDYVPVRIAGDLPQPTKYIGYVSYTLDNVGRSGCIYRISGGVLWVFQRTRPDETEIDGLWHCAAFTL